MTTERGLQRVDQQRSEVEVISPAAVVALATERANVLMDIIKKRKLSVSIKGNDYPLFEAWQIIGAFDSAAPSTESVEPLRDQETGEIIGYKAKVNIMKHGEVISSAISMCGMDEHVTQGQNGSAKHNAAMSMAQTRAASKAYRAAYSFIMELAGLKATPAEEMPRDDAPAVKPPTAAKARPSAEGRPVAANEAAAPNAVKSLGDLFNAAKDTFQGTPTWVWEWLSSLQATEITDKNVVAKFGSYQAAWDRLKVAVNAQTAGNTEEAIEGEAIPAGHGE